MTQQIHKMESTVRGGLELKHPLAGSHHPIRHVGETRTANKKIPQLLGSDTCNGGLMDDYPSPAEESSNGRESAHTSSEGSHTDSTQ